MSDPDDSTRVNTSASGGWSVYKRLVMRMVETCVADVRELFDRVTRLESDFRQLRDWVRDNGQESDGVRDRVSALETDVANVRVAVEDVSQHLSEQQELAKQVAQERLPSPGIWVEIWRHPVGKVLATIVAVATLLAAGALYNVVTDRQVDISDHIPRLEGGP